MDVSTWIVFSFHASYLMVQASFVRNHFRSRRFLAHSTKTESAVASEFAAMPPKDSGFKKIPDKMTDAEKKKKQQENKAKANPKLSEAKKEKNDACR